MLGYEQISLEEDEFTTQWKAIATEEERDSFLKEHIWKDAVWFLASNQLYQLNPGDNTYSLVANAPSLTQLVTGAFIFHQWLFRCVGGI